MTQSRPTYVLQPTVGTNQDALRQLLLTPGGRTLDVAAAYVTNPGVTALADAAKALDPARWDGLVKRLLVGVDWLRPGSASSARVFGVCDDEGARPA